MNREEYQQVKQIFHDVLDIASDERTAFLDEACAGNEVLRREVEKLLNSFETGYLEQPAIGKFAETIVSSNLAVGQEIGHYKIVEKIGAGGMGEVYLAEDSTLDRQVAIKILPREFTEDKERIRRFIREAKFVSALNHPNIVTIHEIGQTDGQQFIASEYIEGETLRAHLKREKLSLSSALEISIQIASALDAAHGAGIIHRDIKPDNIMIRPDSLVKVLDFGVAKLIEQARETSDAQTTAAGATNPGMIVGTANYMSPEQARGDEEIDERTDIFNFGIVLYEMVSGKRAFEGANTMDVIGAILHKEPLPLNQIMPELPEAIERIVSKTLRKDRGERFQTAKDLLTELKEAKQDLEFRDKLQTSAPANKASSAEFISIEVKKHKRGFVAALLVLLFAAIGFGYWFYANSAANTRQIESIAVMPFVNDSGNADAEYLSDGMTETLISSLSRLSNLNVKARSTVFRYKGKAMSVQTIGAELNVQAILIGRFAQRGDQLTLTLELVDAQTENIIWSEQYNRRQTDLVSLVSEIARDVSQKLKTKLSGADEAQVAKKSTENTKAYKLYLRGKFYLNMRVLADENIKKAIDQFQSAVEEDPNYALAFAGLAHCYSLLPEYFNVQMSEALPQAKVYANRALELDDSLSEAHAALGYIHEISRNWAESEKEYKRAIDLNPNYPDSHFKYFTLLQVLGRFDEALSEIKRANELDPSRAQFYLGLGYIYLLRGELDSATVELLKGAELTGGQGYMLTWVYLKQGRTVEALAQARKNLELSKNDSGDISLLGCVYARAGYRKEALTVLKELEEKYTKREADEFDLAKLYANLSENDKAFEMLEKGFQDGDVMYGFRTAPAFEPLRADPRFNDLLRRMNLPEVY